MKEKHPRDRIIDDQIEQINQLKTQLNEIRAERDQMLASRSWRLTVPLRSFGAFLRRLRKTAVQPIPPDIQENSLRDSEEKSRQIQEQLAHTPLFDAEWYLAQYADVAEAGIEPLQHYIEHGTAEGRNPNPYFDTSWYLETYPDVAAAGINPLLHYIENGAAEGHNPSPVFDTKWYLKTYPDIAASGINPLQHYVVYGAKEDRQPMKGHRTASHFLKASIRNAQRIPSYYVEGDVERLNLVTDSIGPKRLFGGVATALIIASHYAEQSGIPLRIITRDDRANPIHYYNILRLHRVTPPNDVVFYSDFDRDVDGDKNNRLDVSTGDVFFATSWWSAEAIRKTTLQKKFFYAIQEVETFFYPHGDELLRCQRIMRDQDIIFLVNTKLLFDYFKMYEPVVYQNGLVFEPAFPLYQPGRGKNENDKYKLFFYARPNNPRNLFMFGIEVLNIGISTGIIDTEEWDIYFLGDDTPSIRFDNGYEVINLGRLDWDAYAEFLQTVDLSLSLMYTPHPSYPPFDVAASGGVVLSNKCLNKIEFPYSDNVILADLEIESFLESMKQAVALATNSQKRLENFQRDKILRDWNQSLPQLRGKMREFLHGCVN